MDALHPLPRYIWKGQKAGNEIMALRYKKLKCLVKFNLTIIDYLFEKYVDCRAIDSHICFALMCPGIEKHECIYIYMDKQKYKTSMRTA